MKVYKNGKGYYCRAYDKVTNKTKVIHGRTSQEALHKAHEFELRHSGGNFITFGQAYEEMVEGRTTLSPSTLRGYSSYYNTHLKYLENRKLTEINTKIVQRLIDSKKETLSSKSISNIYGLITAILSYHGVDGELKVRLPKKPPKKKKLPTTQEVKDFINNCDDEVLKTILELSVYGGLRRGESCAITKKDIIKDGDVYKVVVNKAWAQGADMVWVLKEPKSYQGYREVSIPDFLAEKILNGDDLNFTPCAITCRYSKYARKAKFNYNMHLLRHWSASYMKHRGVSDQEVMERFGWSSLDMLKVYVDVIDDERTDAVRQLANALM